MDVVDFPEKETAGEVSGRGPAAPVPEATAPWSFSDHSRTGEAAGGGGTLQPAQGGKA